MIWDFKIEITLWIYNNGTENFLRAIIVVICELNAAYLSAIFATEREPLVSVAETR